MGAPADLHLHREAPLRLFSEEEIGGYRAVRGVCV